LKPPHQLNAKKKEVVDTDALIERYRKEIEELKARLAEREAVVPVRSRRLSAREVSQYHSCFHRISQTLPAAN
jgi:centromeric protein E